MYEDDLKFWVIIIGIFIGVVFLAWGVTVFDCATYKKSTGKEVKMDWGTCYVKVDGEWFSKDQVRGVNK